MRNKIFRTVQHLLKPRANFDLSHTSKGSMRMGNLYPMMCEPTLPGDTFKVNHSALARFAPMTAPIMHNIDMRTYYFHVPMRLIWPKFREFITGGVDGDEQPIFPRLVFREQQRFPAKYLEWFYPGTLMDYLNFPTLQGEVLDDIQNTEDEHGLVTFNNLYPIEVDLTPFIGYALLYNEYFRDQNLDEPLPVDQLWDLLENDGFFDISRLFRQDLDGTVTENDDLLDIIQAFLELRVKCWDKNYFTSALPEPQRGESVQLPLDTTGIVEYLPANSQDRNEVAGWRKKASNQGFTALADLGAMAAVGDEPSITAQVNNTNNTVEYDPGDSLRVNINEGNTDINELRRAIKLQEFLEAMARGGSRYIEQIKTIFGVTSSDARLQRPEFLSSTSQPIVVSEVLQTSQTTAGSAQGNMSGRAVSASVNKGFARFFEEHGLVYAIVCVMPKFESFNGLPRKWHKFDRFDYFWPQFDHIGEQEIKMNELSYDFSYGEDATGFGYAPRYAEYKSSVDEIHGEFRNTLSFWHMANDYHNVALNSSFIRPTRELLERPFALQDGKTEQVYVEMYFKFTAKRMMSRYSTPLID